MKITMYSTSTCTTCGALEQWLAKNGQTYTKKMADEDPAIMEEFMAVNDGMIGVPFTVIEDDNGELTKITGYDRAKFQSALNL